MALESYLHHKQPGQPGGALLFTFHGTGGDEKQLVALGRDLVPEATIVSPRGDVSEAGAARFFRRTSEGVYDMEDLARATGAMSAFIRAHVDAAEPSHVLGLGYSNGANILASVMFAQPDMFDRIVLMHPLIPFEPQINGTLSGARLLVTAGERDPICPPHLTHRLLSHLQAAGATVETLWHPGGHEVRPDELAAATRFLTEETKA
ncbi:alpha/beta hydrolase [Tianweitania sediminis]|uniref:Alpha/beta hydrolase n=1 Tax=Tianweitania sediminis TaxID=1502156 RepID=A0A8J7UIZ5_9HYPH|nr:alpha/beta hydrolase [Tianweitania sediminis]MBP0438164.1 alpha/beta hydrolase [Tianweitania sediminis]